MPKAADNEHAERLLVHYRQLLRVRRCEERLMTLFADGEVPGFIHLSIGQEAVSVGVMSELSPTDTIASTHRGHGHAIAKGIPLAGFFAELLARDSGVCRGRGGSMHVADMRVGMLGANGIVGAGLPIALGSALAHRTRKSSDIAVSFFGDGALAEGVLHETVNIAALWKLPILFVCEANGWSEFSPVSRQIAFGLENWSKAFGLPYRKVDGNDVAAVADAAAAMIAPVRAGSGPALLECVTSRRRGHYEGDAQKYRPADEAAARDPIDVTAEQLAGYGIAEQRLTQVAAEVDGEVEQAIATARRAAPAQFADLHSDVYTVEPA
ncbi:MAG: transporter substrate-binding protein [Novosphingobium sp.]|nr:transporter substrate-binding protein [Novosphingobium sp.]